MTKRYAIWVRELGSDNERIACEVDRNPWPIVEALRERDMTASVRVEDRAEKASP